MANTTFGTESPPPHPAADDVPRLQFDRWTALRLAALLAFLALNAAAIMRLLGEEAGTNSYVLLAQSWLDGRLDLPACWDADCALFEGRIHNIFPPVPALVLVPFVAVFGAGFAGTLALAYVLYLATGWLWWRIVRALGRSRDEAFWLLLAVLAGSPLYIVYAGSDTVWFFAQIVGFFLVTLALHEALAGRLVAAGAAIGAAFLSRQMSIFYAPFLLVLATPREVPWFRLDRAALRRALQLGAPIAAAILVYLTYNYARFGDPLDTGYGFMQQEADTIGLRITNYGLFSSEYLLFNLLYFFYQGFHAEFTQPMLLSLDGMDRAGAALLAASPYLLLLFLVKIRRELVIGGFVAGFLIAVTLFYHSNGFVQYGAQRYTLDWLPIAFYALAAGLAADDFRPLRLLVAWSVAMTAITVLLLATIRGGTGLG